MNSYRLDIDGLRAIAVMIVIGFHLDMSWLAGGHIGVDVFFVLSGFLITSIISKQIQQNNFSIKRFYIRRINRLFPALYATIFLSFIAYISHKNITIYQITIDHNLKIIVDKSHKKVHNILP